MEMLVCLLRDTWGWRWVWGVKVFISTVVSFNTGIVKWTTIPWHPLSRTLSRTFSWKMFKKKSLYPVTPTRIETARMFSHMFSRVFFHKSRVFSRKYGCENLCEYILQDSSSDSGDAVLQHMRSRLLTATWHRLVAHAVNLKSHSWDCPLHTNLMIRSWDLPWLDC